MERKRVDNTLSHPLYLRTPFARPCAARSELLNVIKSTPPSGRIRVSPLSLPALARPRYVSRIRLCVYICMCVYVCAREPIPPINSFAFYRRRSSSRAARPDSSLSRRVIRGEKLNAVKRVDARVTRNALPPIGFCGERGGKKEEEEERRELSRLPRVTRG